MSRKVFHIHIGIDLDVHAVSCPGVWLCPKGDAMLRISMLGASSHTKRVEPNFPLLFHENFHFRKTLTGITSLAGLQAELRRRSVLIQLVQWEVHGCRCVILAVFRSSLTELLYPQPASRGLVAGVDIDLLMESLPCFPGIIAPKVEVSTKVVVEEMVNYPSRDHESLIISHKTLSSKGICNQIEKEDGNKNEGRHQNKAEERRSRLRQKPVCHTRPNVRCYSCKTGRMRQGRGRGRGGKRAHCGCGGEQADTLYIPYCSKCRDFVEGTEVKQGKIVVKESSMHTGKWETVCPCVEPQRSKSACDCSLCRKYQDLFRNTVPSLSSAFTTNTALKSPKWRFDRSPSPPKKDKQCPCVGVKSGEGVSRLRAGTSDKPKGTSVEDKGDGPSGVVRERQVEDYRSLFSADLDARYRQLYERVSQRSNRRGN